MRTDLDHYMEVGRTANSIMLQLLDLKRKISSDFVGVLHKSYYMFVYPVDSLLKVQTTNKTHQSDLQQTHPANDANSHPPEKWQPEMQEEVEVIRDTV